MSLWSYIGACQRLSEELVQAMSPDEIETLRQSVQGLSQAEWDQWRTSNEHHIARFVGATPSERNKRKDWQKPILRLQLTLAAIQHLRQAEIVLRVTAEEYLQPGGSYRMTAAQAGCAYGRILREEIADWPFEGESPFCKTA